MTQKNIKHFINNFFRKRWKSNFHCLKYKFSTVHHTKVMVFKIPMLSDSSMKWGKHYTVLIQYSYIKYRKCFLYPICYEQLKMYLWIYFYSRKQIHRYIWMVLVHLNKESFAKMAIRFCEKIKSAIVKFRSLV